MKNHPIDPPLPNLFNSQLETGIRSLIILEFAHPKSFDLLKLTWFDHLVVHTGEIGGPPSLHPNLPQQGGEILVRRRMIENGLAFMRSLGLIKSTLQESGIAYSASDDAYSFVELLRSPYSEGLKERARWLRENLFDKSDQTLSQMIASSLGRWNIEFQENLNSPR